MDSKSADRRGELNHRKSIAAGLVSLLIFTFPMAAQTGAVLVPRPKPGSGDSAAIAARPAITAQKNAVNVAILPVGFPLRVQIDRRYRLHAGERVQGKLIDPVYWGDHIVLPANTVVDGRIVRLEPIRGTTRTWAVLDGDVTPLKQPVIAFDNLDISREQDIRMSAEASERTTSMVTMKTMAQKQSFIGKVKAQVDAKIASVGGIVHSPHKSDLALKFFYGQLPYHPQEIWAGTQFDAILVQPLAVPSHAGQSLPITPPHGHIPPGTLDARLITPISSSTDKLGDPVVAVLTRPYLNASKTDVILPTDTRLKGIVTQAKPARLFARNGVLRFTFREIELPGGEVEQMQGQMTAVEGVSGQHVTVDSEGGAKANSPQGKFLAPLLLGALASNSYDADQNAVHAGVSSNGFGLVTRIVAFAVVVPAMTATLAYYSLGKSIVRRWIMPGQNIVFAKNTRLELAVADR